jgi:hypothetical protein
MKISVIAASRIPSAISFGVLRRSAPSTGLLGDLDDDPV